MPYNNANPRTNVECHDQCSPNVLASLKLTTREAEVLLWISQGKSNQDIGTILGAKTGTICKHVEHILSKLNVENRTSAAVVALETFRSVAKTSQEKSCKPWPAVADVITTQFGQLNLTNLPVPFNEYIHSFGGGGRR
jgi:DNA-binding CsgD family transcriptional regulator